jgi:hypothetical protein
MAKVTVRANHTIRVCIAPGKAGDKAKGIAPTKPVVKDYEKGTLFNMDADEAKALEKQDALKIVGDAPAAPEAEKAKPAAKAPRKAKEAAPVNPATTTPVETPEGDADDGGEGSDPI